MIKPIQNATNVALLNQVIYNVFTEFDNTVENRNTFIEDGKIMRWMDSKFTWEMPTKVEIRDCTEEETKIWEAYVSLTKALSDNL